MLLQRILTVVVAAPVLIGSILCPWPRVFQAIVLLCLFAALLEYYRIVGFSRSDRAAGMAAGLFHSFFLLFFPGELRNLPVEMSLVPVGIFTYFCLCPGGNQGSPRTAERVGLTVLGTFYIGTFGSFVGMIRAEPQGIYWVLTLLGMTWLNDTAAYFVGHRFGRRRLATRLSPGKTVEGFLGGFAGSLAGFLLFWFLFDRPIALPWGLLLVLAAGIVGPLGDLSESLIKRSFEVKDSGNMIPGHGGMLDRIDALLFTAPVVYAFAAWLG